MQNIGKFPLKAWQSQLIQNQATSLFVFTLPDRLGLTSIFEHAADAHSEEVRAEIAGRALKVRKAAKQKAKMKEWLKLSSIIWPLPLQRLPVNHAPGHALLRLPSP